MANNDTTTIRVSKTVHDRVMKAQDGTGVQAQVFVERALVTYLDEHAADIKAEKERVLKIRGKQ